MLRSTLTTAVAFVLGLLAIPGPIAAQQTGSTSRLCRHADYEALGRNPGREELRCRFGVTGPGRFGLLSYADVPVYQPVTPMPGTHLMGVPGQPRPALFESFEAWEWRVLRTKYSPEVHRVNRDLASLDPRVAELIGRLEDRLAEEGIAAHRVETWRSPQRQAYLFQQGRSRPGPLATTTLTSWHSQMDSRGFPAGRAVDYDVSWSSLPRFHEIAREVGLDSFGADSNDPGHVFLPRVDALPQPELALLRTIPRVPEVTLATGLPVDESLPPGGPAVLREKAAQFAALPFIPFPVPELSIPSVGPDLRLREPAMTRRATEAPLARGTDDRPGQPNADLATRAASVSDAPVARGVGTIVSPATGTGEYGEDPIRVPGSPAR